MAAYVLICRKATGASARKDTPARIVKKRKVNAEPIHARHVQCAKMNRAVEITRASVEVATQALIAMSLLIHAQSMEIHARMAHHVLH